MAISRTNYTQRYGVDLAVFTLDSDTTYYQYVTDATLGVSLPTTSGRAAKDLDILIAAGASSATIDASNIITDAYCPMLTIALSDTPYFTAILRPAATSDSYTNATANTTGKFLLTSCKTSVSEGAITESWSAVMQGALASTTPTTATVGRRSDLASTQFGVDVGSLEIGTGNDFLAHYDSFDIDVSIGTAVESAVMDTWQWPVQTERKIVLNASRIVDSPVTTPAASLYWTNIAIARTIVAVSIEFGGGTFSGNMICTDAKWSLGGANGAQKETITLENYGAMTFPGS